MVQKLRIFFRTVNKLQILIGLITLFLGTMVYLTDRIPEQIYFFHSSFYHISLHNSIPNLFGSIGNSLPSFIHVFSFALITAGFIGWRKRGCFLICASWALVNCIFELGQKYNSWLIKLIPDWFARIPFLENTENYFVHGTFDYIDLVAIVIGSISAYFIVIVTMERRKYES